MNDLYEVWAAETLTYANQDSDDPLWRDRYEEMASELLSLANLVLGQEAA